MGAGVGPKKKIKRPRISLEMRERLRAALREAKTSGGTIRSAAASLGVSVTVAWHEAQRLGLKFKQGTRGLRDKNAAALPMMAALYRDGYTLNAVGEQFGVTRERVRQLLTKHLGITAKDGGARIKHQRTGDARKRKRDMRALAKHGCTWEQYCTLRSGRRSPTRLYAAQRRNAAIRGIGWELNLWQWWMIWQESGHWAERGRGQGYVMCRVKDQGPYAVGNVFIAPAIENNSNTKNKKSDLPIGVRFIKRGNYETYTARRIIRGEKLYLGCFKSADLAHAAYLAAAPTSRSAA